MKASVRACGAGVIAVLVCLAATVARAETARSRIEQLAREEQEGVAGLIRFLHRRHATPPVLGSFPSSFTTTNFVSLEHLLPVLEKDLTLRIAQVESWIPQVPDAEARALLQANLEMKHRHLDAVQEMARHEAHLAALAELMGKKG